MSTASNPPLPPRRPEESRPQSHPLRTIREIRESLPEHQLAPFEGLEFGQRSYDDAADGE
ncbi:hypothetical protein ABTX82_09850 [Streptomyces lavendulae]|uniref:hypothetical protein n=1 Tax=Streptomyces lavendulae TaxID=1914 RepID=UPI00331C7A88